MTLSIRINASPEIRLPRLKAIERNGHGGEMGRAGNADDGCGVAAVSSPNQPGCAGMCEGGGRVVPTRRGLETRGQRYTQSVGGRDVHRRGRALIGAESELLVNVRSPRF